VDIELRFLRREVWSTARRCRRMRWCARRAAAAPRLHEELARRV